MRKALSEPASTVTSQAAAPDGKTWRQVLYAAISCGWTEASFWPWREHISRNDSSSAVGMALAKRDWPGGASDSETVQSPMASPKTPAINSRAWPSLSAAEFNE